ncbi:MAG: hypothetical protein JJU42_03795 [Rhodobacteraceae bacterium]|nr:hypothetical protein [Paracoccaceae bacterium]
MSAPQEPLFVARETFRRRRLMDAARLLPVLGLFLVLLPMMWPAPEGEAPRAAREGVYLFLVWFGLIIAAAVLARRLSAVLNGESGTASGEGEM